MNDKIKKPQTKFCQHQKAKSLTNQNIKLVDTTTCTNYKNKLTTDSDLTKIDQTSKNSKNNPILTLGEPLFVTEDSGVQFLDRIIKIKCYPPLSHDTDIYKKKL